MEKKSAFFIVGILGGLLTYGVSRLIDWSTEGAPRSGEHEAAELRNLKEQVRELEASVASSERLAREAQVTAQAARAAASPRVEARPAPERVSEAVSPLGMGDERPPMGGTEAAPHEPDPEETVAQLDARFFGEGVDPGWSREARPRAERLGVMLPAGARVVSLECRSSMCRLEMSHPNLESFQGFVRDGLMGGENEWDGAFMAALKGDPGLSGGVQAVAYLARPGIDLSPASLETP